MSSGAAVSAGQRVLVNGAGGGVGGFAVQLAKHAGAHVIATAGPRSAGTVRGFGAVRLDVSASRPLADLASVHRDAESARTRGKVILVP